MIFGQKILRNQIFMKEKNYSFTNNYKTFGTKERNKLSAKH